MSDDVGDSAFKEAEALMGFYKSRQVTAFVGLVSGQEQVWPRAAVGREARAWAGASPALLCCVPAGCLLKA